MKYIILLTGIVFLFSCTPTHHFSAVQEFKDNKAISAKFAAPDTLTLIHHYKWKHGRIVSVQDMKKVNGVWVSYGEWYSAPDSIENVVINGFVKN